MGNEVGSMRPRIHIGVVLLVGTLMVIFALSTTLLVVAARKVSTFRAMQASNKHFERYMDTMSRASQAYKAGHYDVALKEYRRASELTGEDTTGSFTMQAHFGIAKTYRRMNQLENAVAEYRSIIARDPVSSHPRWAPWAHFHLGQALLSKGELEEARSEWRIALASSGTDPHFSKLRPQVQQALTQNPARSGGK